MKAGPVAAMIGLIALGVWLVAGSGLGAPSVADGHRIEPLRVGTEKLWVESWIEDAQPMLRVLDAQGNSVSEPTLQELESLLGPAAGEYAHDAERNVLFRVLNISGWASLVWVAIGFGGQIAFFGRMFIQWVMSERSRQSVVPPLFWYLSLLGGVCLFLYFVWRKDIVGVLGQSSGVVIYARNVRLILKQRRREARASAEASSESGADPATEQGDTDEDSGR